MSRLVFWLDDQIADNRIFYDVLITRMRADVEVFNTNKQLVQALRKTTREPDLIIHDLHHPDDGLLGETPLPGWALQERILRREYPHISTVILSNASDFPERDQTLRRPELTVLSKTIFLADFESVLNTVFHRIENPRDRYLRIVESMSKKLARQIASDPNFLQEVEWRYLERVIATVFEASGFDVELTPPSKDKGRDVVAECRIEAAQ